MTKLFKQLPIAEKLWADHKDPNNYTIESKAIIKWKCENGHIYKKAINKFANNQECQI
ncbi:MAG: zinc-ribbon domain-containing protein [Lactobacillus johnsonii]|nr:zinc-ribbon domain-containing protein [Lactobacillus johnsonii]